MLAAVQRALPYTTRALATLTLPPPALVLYARHEVVVRPKACPAVWSDPRLKARVPSTFVYRRDPLLEFLRRPVPMPRPLITPLVDVGAGVIVTPFHPEAVSRINAMAAAQAAARSAAWQL